MEDKPKTTITQAKSISKVSIILACLIQIGLIIYVLLAFKRVPTMEEMTSIGMGGAYILLYTSPIQASIILDKILSIVATLKGK